MGNCRSSESAVLRTQQRSGSLSSTFPVAFDSSTSSRDFQCHQPRTTMTHINDDSSGSCGETKEADEPISSSHPATTTTTTTPTIAKDTGARPSSSAVSTSDSTPSRRNVIHHHHQDGTAAPNSGLTKAASTAARYITSDDETVDARIMSSNSRCDPPHAQEGEHIVIEPRDEAAAKHSVKRSADEGWDGAPPPDRSATLLPGMESSRRASPAALQRDNSTTSTSTSGTGSPSPGQRAENAWGTNSKNSQNTSSKFGQNTSSKNSQDTSGSDTQRGAAAGSLVTSSVSIGGGRGGGGNSGSFKTTTSSPRSPLSPFGSPHFIHSDPSTPVQVILAYRTGSHYSRTTAAIPSFDNYDSSTTNSTATTRTRSSSNTTTTTTNNNNRHALRTSSANNTHTHNSSAGDDDDDASRNDTQIELSADSSHTGRPVITSSRLSRSSSSSNTADDTTGDSSTADLSTPTSVMIACQEQQQKTTERHLHLRGI